MKKIALCLFLWVFFLVTASATVTYQIIQDTAVMNHPGDVSPVIIKFTSSSARGEYIKLETEYNYEQQKSARMWRVRSSSENLFRKAHGKMKMKAKFDDLIYIPRTGKIIYFYPIGFAGSQKFDISVYDSRGNLLFVIDPFYYSDWAYRLEITIGSNDPYDKMGQVVHFVLPRYDGMNDDYSDLRFTQVLSNGTEIEIPYFIRSYDNSSVDVYIRLYEYNAYQTHTVFAYFGNPNATSNSTLETFDAAIWHCQKYGALSAVENETCINGTLSFVNTTSGLAGYMWNVTSPAYYTLELYNATVGISESLIFRVIYYTLGTSYLYDTTELHKASYMYRFRFPWWEWNYIFLTHNQQSTTYSSASTVPSHVTEFYSKLYQDKIEIEFDGNTYEYSSGSQSNTSYNKMFVYGSQFLATEGLFIYQTLEADPNIEFGELTINTRLHTNINLRYTGRTYQWEIEYVDFFGNPVLNATVQAEILYPNGTVNVINFTWNENLQKYVAYFSTDLIGSYEVTITASRDGYVEGYAELLFDVVNPADSQIIVHDTGEYTTAECVNESTALYILRGEACQFENTQCSDYEVTKLVKCDFGCEEGIGCRSFELIPGATTKQTLWWVGWIALAVHIIALALTFMYKKIESITMLIAIGSGIIASAFLPSPWSIIAVVGTFLVLLKVLI